MQARSRESRHNTVINPTVDDLLLCVFLFKDTVFNADSGLTRHEVPANSGSSSQSKAHPTHLFSPETRQGSRTQNWTGLQRHARGQF